ncbi:Ribosome biogenesis protein nsa1 (NOP7-associated protein 1) [Basidiobolus ranarum]|uniref:Ribosome biogenesis protein NSA1 n=1 Tax=Basidiobolus ranarum TaxID=34480 RepID=A0ABR2VR33_9FUNG
MRVHPQQSNILATGVKERDLIIKDINQITSTPNGEVEPIFKAKNAGHLYVLITMDFSDDINKVVVETKYHQIRLYDTKAARRPVMSVEIGEHPIVSLALAPNQTEIICSDSIENLSTADIRTGKCTDVFFKLTHVVVDEEEDVEATPEEDENEILWNSMCKINEAKTTKKHK